MICNKCHGVENYGRIYCHECAKLGMLCLHCGYTNDEHDKYCSGCGLSTADMTELYDKKKSQTFSERHKRFISQYDSAELETVISQAEKLKSAIEERVIPTYQQDDIDKLFSEQS
jgi:hypothetical protein